MQDWNWHAYDGAVDPQTNKQRDYWIMIAKLLAKPYFRAHYKRIAYSHLYPATPGAYSYENVEDVYRLYEQQ